MVTPTAAQKQSFLSRIVPLATSYGSASGIDPNLIISQAALESNYGLQAPNNNFFGIKGSTGGTFMTQEYDASGSLVSVPQNFAGYSSLEDSVKGFVNLLTTSPRYANVVGATGTDAFQNIQTDGYGGANNTTMAGRLAAVSNSIGLTSSPGTEAGGINGIGMGAGIGTLAGDISAPLVETEQAVVSTGSSLLGDAIDAGEVGVGIATGNPLLIAKGIGDFLSGGSKSSSGSTSPGVISSFLTWVKNLFSANTAARLVAIVVGVVLIAIALAYLTGADKVISTTVKTAGKAALVAA